MGAFFLHHKDIRIDTDSLNAVYKKKGFSAPHVADIGNYRLYLYGKRLIKADNFYYDGGNAVYACGSFFYKESGYAQSLRSLLSDFLNGSIIYDQLYGNYILIFFTKNDSKIAVITDPPVIKNIYFDKERQILSTDFLALMAAKVRPYTFNRIAVIENLTTGNLITPDTYVTEVNRVDKVNFIDLGKLFPGISFKKPVPALFENITDRNAAVNDANERLSEYFRSANGITRQFGAHLGLTGGFDSRLLLIHARKHLPGLITNSFWRPDSKDFLYAKQLSEKSAVEFISFERGDYIKSSVDEMIESSYYFFDGQIRSQNNWSEEFSASDYATKIASGHFIGFHGCGGEQYRNSERILHEKGFTDYVYYDWLIRQGDKLFLDDILKNELLRSVRDKIRRLTGISGKRIGLDQVKRIQNEVWIASNRATRINVLNQLMFYFAPFTEYQISYPAYRYVPFLGSSSAFEIEMINKADKELASVITNYGYAPLQGEPFISKLLSLAAGIMTRPTYYKLNRMIRKRRDRPQPLINGLMGLNPFMVEVGKVINLAELSSNKNLGWEVIAFNKLTGRLLSHNLTTKYEDQSDS